MAQNSNQSQRAEPGEAGDKLPITRIIFPQYK